jgi:glycerol-3-phosphate cytidylyltransferase
MIIGLIVGVFDLYHPGHVITLQECKNHCDKLILGINVGINFDLTINPGKRKPVYSLEERLLILNSVKYIDELFSYNSEVELLDYLKRIKPDIRFLGDDYRGRRITGEEFSSNIHFVNRSHGYSTTSVLERINKNTLDDKIFE